MELIRNLRSVRPDIAITSDVMVGFPGETKDDFKKTLDLMQKIEFDNVFSFKYSDRKGTVAAGMDGKIDEDEKSSRLAILQKQQKFFRRRPQTVAYFYLQFSCRYIKNYRARHIFVTDAGYWSLDTG